MYLHVLIVILMAQSIAKGPQLPNHVIPLYGNISLGYYYANIYVGSPPQEQSVIVDTGSGQLALPCSKCQSCGKSHIHPPFKLSQSKTSKILACNSQEEACRNTCGNRKQTDLCTFSISYAEGSSLSGIIIEDQIQFEGDSVGESIKTSFGCTTTETNLFYTQAANGIFGLAPLRQSNLFQKLHTKHSPNTGEQLLFSLCIAKNGGQLVIGKPRLQIHSSPDSVRTSFSKSRNLYTLDEVGQIRLGGKVLKSKKESTGSYGVFIDSGSTFTYLPRKNYQALLVALENSCALFPDMCLIAQGRSTCYKITPENRDTVQQTILKIFPPFEVQIGKDVVLWSPADYFTLRSLKSKQICLAIQPLDRFLLGGNWMVNRDIVFNLKENTVQIFSNSRCSIEKQVKPQIVGQPAEQTQKIQVEAKLANNQQIVQQPIQQQMPVYMGETGNQQISYINAIFRQDNSITENLIILICILMAILAVLVAFSKCFGKKPQRNKLKQEEVEVVTILESSVNIKTNNLNNSDEIVREKNKHSEIPSEDIPQEKEPHD